MDGLICECCTPDEYASLFLPWAVGLITAAVFVSLAIVAVFGQAAAR